MLPPSTPPPVYNPQANKPKLVFTKPSVAPMEITFSMQMIVGGENGFEAFVTGYFNPAAFSLFLAMQHRGGWSLTALADKDPAVKKALTTPPFTAQLGINVFGRRFFITARIDFPCAVPIVPGVLALEGHPDRGPVGEDAGPMCAGPIARIEEPAMCEAVEPFLQSDLKSRATGVNDCACEPLTTAARVKCAHGQHAHRPADRHAHGSVSLVGVRIAMQMGIQVDMQVGTFTWWAQCAF